MRFSLVLIIFLVCPFGILGQRRVSREEYSIYAAALREVHRQDREQLCTVSPIVVLSSCAEPRLVILSTTGGGDTWIFGKDKNIMKGLSGNFLLANQTRSVFQHRIPVRFHYDLISQLELNDLLYKSKAEYEVRKAELKRNCRSADCGSQWRYFYERFPNARQYYQLSRIGFSTNRKFCIVEINGTGEGCFRSGWTVWLKKVKGGWQMYQMGGGAGDC